jgi:hypothetical protein
MPIGLQRWVKVSNDTMPSKKSKEKKKHVVNDGDRHSSGSMDDDNHNVGNGKVGSVRRSSPTTTTTTTTTSRSFGNKGKSRNERVNHNYYAPISLPWLPSIPTPNDHLVAMIESGTREFHPNIPLST